MVRTKLLMPMSSEKSDNADIDNRHEEGKPDQGQPGGDGQRVAPPCVPQRHALEHVDEGDGGDDEVGAAVEDVPELDEEMPTQEQVLDGLLVVEAEEALDPNDRLGVDEGEVTSSASFVDDLGADSLDTVELVMAFEEGFGIEIPDEDAEKIQTVKDAISYIESHAKA